MANEDASKLFVAGLPDSVTEDVLRRLFEATGGTVVNVSLPKDRATGRPRGFGFVTLSSPQEASNARDALDGSVQAGRPISVRPFSSEPPRPREAGRPGGDAPGGPSGPVGGPSEDRTLYVGNLPYDVTQQEIETLFADNGVGPVARIHLPVGPDGRPRGFGFVTLGTAEAANHAIVALRSADVRGRRLMVNIANPRGAGGGAPGGIRGPVGPRGPGGPRPNEPMMDGRPRYEGESRQEERPEDGEEGGAAADGRRGPRTSAATAAAKKKKEKEKDKGKKRSERERGGGGSWQKWVDPDDE
jgi:RNA recognition motif-containing protein